LPVPPVTFALPLIVIVAGSPPGIPGSTNAMRVHRVGDAVSGVAPAYR
jgi:pyruvate kinase